MLLTPEDVGDLHERVVNRAREVVHRPAVRLDQDWIAQVGMVEPELSSDQVGEGGLPRRHEQAHRKSGPARWRVGETAPGVLVGAALTLSGGSLRRKLLGRAEAAVGSPRL